MAQNSQAAPHAAKIGHLVSLANFARQFGAPFWRLNGSGIRRRDLYPADFASVRRVLNT